MRNLTLAIRGTDVRLEVQEDGDPRPKTVDVLELEARELADDPLVGCGLADELAQRRAHVAGGAGSEHRAEQLSRRRLPVRPGDAEDRIREQPRRQLDLAPDGDSARARGGHERRLAGDSWALDEHVDAVEQGEILVVAERPVRRHDLGTTRLERGLRGPARARQPENEDSLQSRNWR